MSAIDILLARRAWVEPKIEECHREIKRLEQEIEEATAEVSEIDAALAKLDPENYRVGA